MYDAKSYVRNESGMAYVSVGLQFFVNAVTLHPYTTILIPLPLIPIRCALFLIPNTLLRSMAL